MLAVFAVPSHNIVTELATALSCKMICCYMSVAVVVMISSAAVANDNTLIELSTLEKQETRLMSVCLFHKNRD